MNYPEQKKKLNDLQELLFQMELTELSIESANHRTGIYRSFDPTYNGDEAEPYRNTLKLLEANYDKIKASL